MKGFGVLFFGRVILCCLSLICYLFWVLVFLLYLLNGVNKFFILNVKDIVLRKKDFEFMRDRNKEGGSLRKFEEEYFLLVFF